MWSVFLRTARTYSPFSRTASLTQLRSDFPETDESFQLPAQIRPLADRNHVGGSHPEARAAYSAVSDRADERLRHAPLARQAQATVSCSSRRSRGSHMAARSIASLTLSFGLVNIPVKLYSATESSSTIRFNLLAKDGSRLKQQYVSEKTGKVVERAEMVKGYEFEKDHFVLFTPDELKALDEVGQPRDRHRRLRSAADGRPDLLRQGLPARARQARRQAVCAADGGDAQERALRAGALELEEQAVRGAGAGGRGRPGAAAAAVCR